MSSALFQDFNMKLQRYATLNSVAWHFVAFIIIPQMALTSITSISFFLIPFFLTNYAL